MRVTIGFVVRTSIQKGKLKNHIKNFELDKDFKKKDIYAIHEQK